MPLALQRAVEVASCVSDALQRTQIDRHALIITPFQRAINRLKEAARGADRHESCGEGIGECMSDSLTYGDAVLYAGDLQDRATIFKKLDFLRSARRDELAELCRQLLQTELVRQERSVFMSADTIEDCADVYAYLTQRVELVDEAAIHALFERSGSMLFEGAQGVLLDENYGFAPYTTWSTTTLANAETLLREHAYAGEVISIGVVRAYATRHGVGPFPTEDRALARAFPDLHNTWNAWQQTFRVGYFDLLLTRYAIEVSGKLDCLAVTHIDRLETLPQWKLCSGYFARGEQSELVDYFEQDEGGGVSRVAWGVRAALPGDCVRARQQGL